MFVIIGMNIWLFNIAKRELGSNLLDFILAAVIMALKTYTRWPVFSDGRVFFFCLFGSSNKQKKGVSHVFLNLF